MRNSFTVAAGALVPAVKYAARYLNPKPTVPAHGGLLFEVDGDRLSIFGFNENVTAKATVEIDASEEPKGGFIVAGRLIDQLVATFPDKPITFEQDGSAVVVTAGRFRATLPAMSEKDYPALPGQATLAGMVSGSDLADAVHRVGAAAARNGDVRTAFLGMHFSFDADFCIPLSGGGEPARSLTLTATDSYRAARQSVRWEPEADEEVTILGEAALPMAGPLIDAVEAFAGPDLVAIGWEEGVLSLTTPTRSLVMRTLDLKDFPNAGLTPIFEQETSTVANLSAKAMLLPLKRADLLKNRDSDVVTLRFTENTLTISASSDGSGDGDEEIDVEYDGPETSMMLRSATLHGGLASAPSDTVTASWIPGTTKPVIFTSPADGTWRYMLVPLRHAGGSK